MRHFKWLLLPLLLIPLLATAAFMVWALNPLAAMPETRTALQNSTTVTVEQGSWLTFRPARVDPQAGLIFYPGGRVDHRAYAPAARQIAEEGYLVVIVPMPLNLAVFGSDKAAEVMAAYPEITRWAVGGHSLGGAMAATFAARNPGRVQGLVLWAAYPAAGDDLSTQDIQVFSIYANQDGLADTGTVRSAELRLPASVRWVEIPGGNHAQFGWYGVQPGDGEAKITRSEQQEQVVAATLELLNQIK